MSTDGLEPPVPGLLVAGAILAVVCAVLCWVFVLMYRTTQKTPEGKHLYRLSILLGLVFTLTVAFWFVPGLYLLKAIIQLVLFGGIAAELWVRILLLKHNRQLFLTPNELSALDEAMHPHDEQGPY